MESKTLEIRDMKRAEIRGLSPMTPEFWSFDLVDFFAEHFGRSYFKPMVAVIKGKIVGTVNGVINGNAGWLGNVIVKPGYREQGIGSSLTATMIDYLRSRGCKSLLLIASEMGEPIYKRFGFEVSTTYRIFRNGSVTSTPTSANIKKIVPEDLPGLLELDREICGEDRELLVRSYPLQGWLYVHLPSNTMCGFYISNLGEGPVLARDSEAGIGLLMQKLHDHEKPVVLPDDNQDAIDYLKANGFEELHAAKRMVLGPEVKWRPHLIFSRIGGWCG